MHHFELERADRGEDRHFGGGVFEVQNLDDAFLQELVEPLAELFILARVRIVQVRETLGRKTRDLVEENGRIGRERVADPEFRVADQADDVAGKSFIQRLAFVGEELV